jgi:hypothetical protein
MRGKWQRLARRGALLALVAVAAALTLASVAAAGSWVSGDIHNHTYLTDGTTTQGEVLRNAFSVYGLDYFANSEHGGQWPNDPMGIPFVAPVWRWITLANYSYPIIQDARETYPERLIIQGLEWNVPTHEHASVGIIGAGNQPSGISNFEYLFDAADLDLSRANEGTKEVSHTETVSASIVTATEASSVVTITTAAAHPFAVNDSVTVAGVAEAGYNGTFTVEAVTDTTFTYTNTVADLPASSGGTASKKVKVVDIPAQPFAKQNVTGDDAVTAVDWLESNYGDQAYMIVNHPSRKNLWHVGDFRAMNDDAPDVAFGMEGLPGHQAEIGRGGYDSNIDASGNVTTDPSLADPTLTAKARTYGGADWMTAQVGGLWDSLLGEGRHFWIFDNSDFHQFSKGYKDAAGNTIGIQYYDFWPGQYAKTWTYVARRSLSGLVNGMRSGNVFVANGDLVKGLQFKAADAARSATMGKTLHTSSGATVTIRIAMRSPKYNENGDPVKVNHVDLIAGDVTAPIAPDSPDYTTKDTNASTHVVKTFTAKSWTVVNGWKVMTFKVKATKDMYVRLRGTNWAPNTANETDSKGNPVVDTLSYVDFPNPVTGGVKPDGSPDLIHGNTPDLAWADLWFYSNPIFVDVK